MRSRVKCLMVAAVLLPTALAACGDDDSGGASDEYCDASLAIETAPEPDIDFESMSEEELSTAVKAYATDTLLPRAEKVQDEAPDELADDIAIGVAAVTELAETGDFETAFTKPEVDAAFDRLHAYDLKECGWEAVDVTASDYAFQGVPDELDEGATSFDFTNKGPEVHHMVVLRRNDGVTETFTELLALPEGEGEESVTQVASIEPAPAGESDYVIADLTKGDYAVICFIAKGTTDMETEGEGPPHFTLGMVSEFSVG